MHAHLFLVLPLHHGVVGETDNFLQGFIDSDFGIVFASITHTFGALLFTAGLALYLYQARLVRVARKVGDMPSLQWLPLAHILNVAGIGLNGMGGLMRLKQGDHPGLEVLGSSLWVQAILIKHLFLVVGIGLALFLTARTYLMARQPEAPRNFLPESRRITSFAVASFATILVASILGGVAGNATLPGVDDGTATAASTNMGNPPPGAAQMPNGVYYANHTATITGAPMNPGRAQSDFLVPDGASEVWVEVSWSSTAAVLDASIKAPEGATIAPKKTNGATRVELAVNEAVVGGTWTVVVTSERAVNEVFRVVGRVTVGPTGNVTERTFALQPGGTVSFAEINLQMAVGERLHYEWWVLAEGPAVDFNIHTHANGETQYPVQGTWARYGGEYVHDTTETDGASLMWENPNPTPVTVHCRIWGEYKFDSEVGT